MFDVDARKVQRTLEAPGMAKLRGLYWHDDETLLIHVSAAMTTRIANAPPRELFRLIAQDVGGGDGRVLPSNYVAFGQVGKARFPPLANLVSARPGKPHTVEMTSYGGCRHVTTNCLIEVDTRTGTATVLKVGNEHTTMWVLDRQGQPAAREDWDWRSHAYRVFAFDGPKVRQILESDDADHPEIAGLTSDGLAVVLLANYGRDHRAVWTVPLDGSPRSLLVDDPDDDITSVYRDPYSGAVIGAYVSGTTGTVRWTDPDAIKRQQSVDKAFPHRSVEVFGWSEDNHRIVARVETPSSPPVYYLIDLAAHKADIAAEEYPGLANAKLGEVRQTTYKARDGQEIPAFLTLPPEYTKGPIPLVVLPHGGPWARDYPKFDWLAQFIATRGYAVLQPQFRGSTGFGQAFQEAGYREWGGLMQDDVTDGVKAMIAQGIADPSHVCIVGASYGGFAALAGAAFTPDLYRCAVSIGGVSDLEALARDSVPEKHHFISSVQSFWAKRIGDPGDPMLAKRSPINSVDKIHIPVLLMWGKSDSVVPTSQSEKMENALRAAGKAVTVKVLEGEDHWLSKTATRVSALRDLERFLRDHL